MNKKAHGFTIVELLIVIVIIAILAAISIVAYRGIQDRARTSSLQSTLAQMAKKIESQRVLNDGNYPSTLADAGLTLPTDGSYTYSGSNAGYCLGGTISNISYRVRSTDKTPSEGTCSGILADGSSCPAGFIVVPGSGTFGTSDFCVMKYQAKNIGGTATSQASGTPWVSITQTSAITASQAACSGCHLMTEPEWMTIAENVLSVASNWSGGSVGSGFIYSGHNDSNPSTPLAASTDDSDGYYGTGNSVGAGTNQRRTLTLTNGEVIWDIAGNVHEWTNATMGGSQQPGLSGESSYTQKQWNNASVQWNAFPSSSRPSAIAGANSYTASQGIGYLYSNYGETGTRAFIRGGGYANGNNAGVLELQLNQAPSNTATSIGFRVVK